MGAHVIEDGSEQESIYGVLLNWICRHHRYYLCLQAD